MRKRIALIIPYYDREFFLGVGRYVALHRNWRMDVFKLISDLPSPASTWPHDGFIVQLFAEKIQDSIIASGKPAVNVSDFRVDWKFPSVYSDNRAIGAMAARHLLEKGFHNLGFVGFTGEQYSIGRREGFIEACRETGVECSVLEHDANQALAIGPALQRTLEWLKAIPKPLGLAACNDMLARYMVETCLDHEVPVPEQVAIVGVDNSPVACNLVEVPISSVVPDMHRIGFEAAQMLDNLMNGRGAPAEPMLIPPTSVEMRQSSDIVAVNDHEVARALRFIRTHLPEETLLEGVVQEASMSRRWLERRFRQTLGRSIMDEIVRERLERAQQLLRETDLPMPKVAETAGFTDLNHLGRSFRRVLKLSPTAYRKQHRVV